MTTEIEIATTEQADRLAIRALVDAYARHADRRDAGRQKSLFTEDTQFVVYMDGEGSEPTQELCRSRGADAGVREPQHLPGNNPLQRPEHRRAGRRSRDRRKLLPGPSPVHRRRRSKLMVASLRYHDTFVKLDGTWRFTQREPLRRLDRDSIFASLAGNRFTRTVLPDPRRRPWARTSGRAPIRAPGPRPPSRGRVQKTE